MSIGSKPNHMAFAKSGKGSNQERQSVGKVSREASASLSGVMKLCLFDERQKQIVDSSHNLCQVANSHSGSVFFQSKIAAVVRAYFDAPMSATYFKQSRGAYLSA